MSVADGAVRKLKVKEEIRFEGAKKLIFRDDALQIYSDSDGNLIIVADVGITLDALTDMNTGHQFNGSADGLVNMSKAGTISDADFTTDTTGLIGIDTSNDRIYYRIGAADWSYVSADGGFSFPEKTCPKCGEVFKIGERLDMMVNGFDSDEAPHAIPVHKDCR